MKPIHNRMPVMLTPDNERVWISDESLEDVMHLLQPYDEKEMNAYPVTKKVNSPKNNDRSVMESGQQLLF
jgi:putative SOS response-associated peptidase YedK